MKFLKLSILAALVVSLTYCNKDLSNSVSVTFKGPTTTFEFSMDTTSKIKSVPVDTSIANFNLDSIAKANNTTLDKISKIEIESMTIYTMYPSWANFDVVDTIQLSLSSPTVPSKVVKLADISTITPGAKTINPPFPDTKDLLEILKQKKIRLYGKLVNKQPITTKAGFKIVFKTKITAGGK